MTANSYNWGGHAFSDDEKERAANLAYEAAADPDWGACLIALALRQAARAATVAAVAAAKERRKNGSGEGGKEA